MRTGTVLIALVTALSACSSGGGMSSSGTGGASNGGTGGAAGNGGPGGGGTAGNGGAGAGGGTAGTGATTGAGGAAAAGGGVAGAGVGQGGVSGAGAAGNGGSGGLVGTGGQAGGPPGYDLPQFPALSAAPCPFTVAPASALCGGRANCPLVTDAEIADASTIYAAPAPSAGYAMYTTQSTPTHLCFLTLTSSGASQAVVDPFPITGNGSVPMVSDPAESPHAFVGTASGISHLHQSSPGTWISDTLDPGGQELGGWGNVVSTNSGLAVLFTTHPPDTGGLTPEVVRLATGDGSGSWTYDVVFDTAAASEVWDPTVAVDRDGTPAVFFETEAATNSAQSLYAWRAGGVAAPFTGPVVSRLTTFQAAATTSADAGPIVSEVDADGLHVWLFRGGALARDAGLAGAFAGEQLTGCGPISSVRGTPNQGCRGSNNMACTMRGDGFYSYAHALGNTADGTTWAVYVVEHADVDGIIHESCTSGPDSSCSCSLQVVTDRTTADLFVARVPAADAAGGLEPRLRVRLGATINTETDGFASVVARGSLLYVVTTMLAGPAAGVPNRYLIIDTSRL